MSEPKEPVPQPDSGEPVYRPFPSFADWGFSEWTSPAFGPFEQLLLESREGATPEALAAAVRTATRYAAVDTGAIEGLYDTDRGFTRTIAIEATAWQASLEARGESTRRAIEDALRAYEMVLDAATRARPVTEVWIRELHSVICASQETFTVLTATGPQAQPLPKGTYKTYPNSPTLPSGQVHAYAPVLDTAAEMGRLVRELNSGSFARAHPVVQSAYAHYAFVCIHPFADGNGRVARALASVYLYRRPGVPLIVFADQKTEYLDALELADGGHPASFVGFIEQRVLDAIELVRIHLRNRTAPPLSRSLDALASSLTGPGGLPHLEVDAVANRILSLVVSELSSQFAQVEAPSVIATVNLRSGTPIEAPEGSRSVKADPRYVEVSLTVAEPVTKRVGSFIAAYPALQSPNLADFVVTTTSGQTPLQIHIREIHPSETEVLRLKLNAWIEVEVETLVSQLASIASETLKRTGYLP